ncbi:MAG TPA: rhomboid family intramembrane serine protease [Solirubrobacteraceae bacterium]|jgi:membrane associated rhomboid family serine protease
MFPIKDNIPLTRVPLVTIVLVAINLVVYLLEIRHGGSFLGGPSDSVAVRYGAIPFELTHPGKHCELATLHELGQSYNAIGCSSHLQAAQPATWETVFLAMFLHGSFLHIFGNMVFLAIFGPTVEDASGPLRYLAFYLLGGLVALGAQVAVEPGSFVPTLGASGAIAAVLGGYILLYPRARVLTLVFIVFFVTIIEVPAFLLLGFWIAEQVYAGASGLANPVSGSEGVAYFAHIGGFAFGLLAIHVIARSDRARLPSRRAHA